MNPTALLRPLLAACALAVLPSCVGVPGEYGGYGGGYDDGPGYSSYQSRPAYYGSGGGYYGGSSYHRPYYGSSYYGGSRYYNDRYDDHKNSSSRSSSSRSSSSSRKSSDDEIRLVKVRDDIRGATPKGYHSKEWYKERGISLSKNTYETRDGDRRGYTGSSSSSKSKSKSNSSSNSNSSSKNKGRGKDD